jgi:hypothetical protein
LVGGIQQGGELAAVVRGGVRDGGRPNKAVRPVDADVVLVTEDRYRDLGRRLALGAAVVRHRRLAAALDRPAAVAVYLRPLRLRPGAPPLLIVSFSARESRGRRASMTVVPTHRQIAALA